MLRGRLQKVLSPSANFLGGGQPVGAAAAAAAAAGGKCGLESALQACACIQLCPEITFKTLFS
jgi:hypothetical protein